jgi:aminoglycoside phosphotransferase (APT) family kinase protein
MCGDNVVRERDGLVVRTRRHAPEVSEGGLSVEQEARLLDLLGRRSPVPVPRVTRVLPELRVMEYPMLPGRPLLERLESLPCHAADKIGRTMGRLLAVLHGLPVEEAGALVPVESASPHSWLEEAGGWYEVVYPHLPAGHREQVESFLSRPPPQPAERLVFSHNDLGVEHVLVDDDWTVTGVIDWTDAAITDPAYDFGLLLRDLGPATLAAARLGYGHGWASHRGLQERWWFYARVTLLEDYAYGLQTGRSAFVVKSQRALPLLFPGAV